MPKYQVDYEVKDGRTLTKILEAKDKQTVMKLVMNYPETMMVGNTIRLDAEEKPKKRRKKKTGEV